MLQMPKVNCRKVAWDDVERWCQAVSDKIIASNWLPDCVVAISRGGYVPSRLICDRLLVGELVSIQVSHWPSAAQKAKEAGVRNPLTCNLDGKRALIVDDISDTGESIIIAKDYVWSNCKPDELRVATLQWLSMSSKIKPDYFAEEIREWVWVQYPWTRLEDIVGFVKRIISEGEKKGAWTLAEIAKAFPEWYGAGFGRWYYKRALDYLVRRGDIVRTRKGYSLPE